MNTILDLPIPFLIVLVGVLVVGVPYLCFRLFFFLWELVEELGYHASGDARRDKELWKLKSQFKQALMDDRYPSEEVLSALASFDWPAICLESHVAVLPDEIKQHVKYLEHCFDYATAVKEIRKEQQIEAQIEAQKQQAEAERKSTENEYSEIIDGIENIVTSCSAPYDEITRTAQAIHGNLDAAPFPRVVKYDILNILKSMSVANGTVPEGLGRLYQAVFARLEPNVCLTVANCVRNIKSWNHNPLKLPVAVEQLRAFDQMKGDHLSQTVAAAYSSFLEAAFTCFPNSVAVTTVRNQYVSLLAPFAPKSVQVVSSPTCPEPVHRTAVSKRGLDAVAGMADLKRQLREEVVDVFRDADKYRRYGISIPNGILLFGPPGCGKTYIARQLAVELGYAFIEIAPSDIGSTYIHGTTLKIRETFEEAAAKAPSVLFIDEFEAFVPARATISSEHQYKSEEVNEFLARLSACAERRILLMAATNRPWEIDPAVQRTGRFDKKIYVAPPDLTARSQMLAHHLDGRYTAADLNTETVASQLGGYSSSDLKLLVDEAAKLAFKASEPIGEKHFRSALSIVRPSISSADEARYQQFGASGALESSKATRKLGFNA